MKNALESVVRVLPRPVPYAPRPFRSYGAFAASVVAFGLLAGCEGTTTKGGEDQPLLPEQELLGGSSGGGTATGGVGGSAGELGSGGLAGSAGASTPSESYRYPAWELEDIQPLSPQFGKTYGLEAFRGRTLVVALFEGYCPYCRSNSIVLEQVVEEIRAEGRDVQLVVLSDANASYFVDAIKVPIFLDPAPGRPTWSLMRPNPIKHDTFVFAPNGKRTFFFEGTYTGDANGYRTEVAAAIRAAAPVSEKGAP